MRILVTGSTGFIGSSIVAALRTHGHDVTMCVHRMADRHLPSEAKSVVVDYMSDVAPEVWRPRLVGVDVVINAVGILREGARARFEELHHLAPSALFRACEQSGVRRVIQISALGADESATSRYHRTKRAADDDLRASSLIWTILQPSVVFGPRGASTQLFLRLASLPMIPLVGRGDQRLQPIHIDDLVAIVIKLVEDGCAIRKTIVVVGPDPVTMRTTLESYRRSLGLGKAFMLRVPIVLIRLAAHIGDILKSGALSTETLHMLLNGNVGPAGATQNVLGYRPRAVNDFIAPENADVLRIRAIWSWLRPALLASVATVWIVAGTASWMFAHERGLALLVRLGLSSDMAYGAFVVACAVNVALGAATLLMPGRALWRAQLVVMAFYTAALSWVEPTLWTDPFGPLVKNLPLAVVLIGLMAVP